MSSQQVVRGRVARVRRVVPAPPERVFDAWTRPDQLGQWFGRPPGLGIRVPDPQVELRVGGTYRIELARRRSLIAVVGTFEEIDPPRRLVFSFCWERHGHRTPETHVSVDFLEHPEGTEVQVVHAGLASRRSHAFHAYGWWDGLVRLRALARNRPNTTE